MPASLFRIPSRLRRPAFTLRMSDGTPAPVPAGIELRAYDSARDLEACLAIWRKASRTGHPFLSARDLSDDENVVRDVYMPAARIIVAERAGAPVGFIALIDSYIGALFVLPSEQGKGVGSRLLEHAVTRHDELIVEVYAANKRARLFYHAHGFAERLCWLRDDQGRALPVIQMIRPRRRAALV